MLLTRVAVAAYQTAGDFFDSQSARNCRLNDMLAIARTPDRTIAINARSIIVCFGFCTGTLILAADVFTKDSSPA